MKFCCGVTLYHPTTEELLLIKKYIEVFDRVYIFDNTESDEVHNYEKHFLNSSFIYISKKENKGLSVAFNEMCSHAYQSGYDYICLFDQDSFIKPVDLVKIMKIIKEAPKKNVGIYAPEINYKHLEMNNNQDDSKKSELLYKEWVISSGSFVNIAIYNNTAGFDENYFIDRIDHDYCLSLSQAGYKVCQIQGFYLYQSLGENKKTLFWNVSQHNALRHYYIFRNRLYFYSKKERFTFYEQINLCLVSIKHILKILITEDQKIKKYKMLVAGYKDFMNGKMGKYNEL